jgi:FtsP/CotA-like multicopper oxidase with cupredoxin domain
MDPNKPDLSELAYDAFLLNGRGNQDPWALQAKPGARIRLRVINAGASTYFKIRLDGHPLKITHAMWHPMHLHGHFFRVVQGAGDHAPLKHTVNVAPRDSVRIEFTADNPGRWIFHCHHFEGGMARVFEYEA